VGGLNRELDREVEGIAPDAEAVLRRYPWPGNVREMRNVLERAILLHSEREVRLEDLPAEVRTGSAPAPISAPGTPGFRLDGGGGIPTMAEVEKMAIEFALQRCGGNKTKAAESLGISRQTLRTKLKEYCLAGVEEEG